MFDEKEVTKKIQEVIVNCMNIAVNTFPDLVDIEQPIIKLDLKGTTAGMYCWFPSAMMSVLRFNPDLLKNNLDEMLTQTVPHEVAHYIVRFLYGSERIWTGKKLMRVVQPHGKEWKYVMSVLGKDAIRCHNMAVTKTRTVKRDYAYSCGCMTYNLTSIRHNKIIKGRKYICKKCGNHLTKV